MTATLETKQIEEVLDQYNSFYITTLKKEVGKDETWSFIVKARMKAIIDFNIAKLISVKTEGGFKPMNLML